VSVVFQVQPPLAYGNTGPVSLDLQVHLRSGLGRNVIHINVRRALVFKAHFAGHTSTQLGPGASGW
jgi:hypothetical protein